MYNVSENFLNTIKQSGRTFKSTVTIRDSIFTDDNIISIDLEENVNPSDTFMLGGVGSSKLEVTIVNPPGSLIIENASVTTVISLLLNGVYEDVPLGVFTVDDIDIEKNTVKITCYDNMVKLEKAYFSSLIYPNSINAVAQEICSKAGIQLATTLPSTQINKIEGYTYREAIGFIASFLGGFARFNRDGKLEIISYTNTGFSVTGDNYFKLKTNQNVFTIGRLSCKAGQKKDSDGNAVDNILTAGSSGNEVQFENPIMTQTQLNNIYNVLKNLSYMPYSMDWQGNHALQAGDKIAITDVDNNVYNTLVMANSINYTGSISGNCSAVGKTETAQEFSSSGSLKNTVDRMVVEQANINYLLANTATIENLTATNANIQTLFADTANISNLVATKATITDLTAANANITNLQANKANITDLTASNARITTLESNTATINNLLAGNITANNIAANTIIAGSSIIADGAIGDAMIADLSAAKIKSGTLDTSMVDIASADGRMIIKNNTLLTYDYVDNDLLRPFLRVQLGRIWDIVGGNLVPRKDASDNYVYGLEIRDKDTQTVMIDGNGVHNAGLTDGAVDNAKVAPNANIDGAKLNIETVVSEINDGGTHIQGSKVMLDNKTLDITLTEIETNVTYKVDIISTNGNVFKNANYTTTLIARVYHGTEDVTDTIDSNRFRWTRISDDKSGDTIWNTSHFGGTKQIEITQTDVMNRATFQCAILNEDLQ